MSNDPASSSAAPAGDAAHLAPAGIAAPDDRLHDHDNDDDHGDAQGTPQSTNRQRRRRKTRKKRNPGLKRKLEFVTHLLKGLDTLLFAELSALYYMEYANYTQPTSRSSKTDHAFLRRCSLFRLIIRAFGHFMYLSPKDETLPIIIPASRTHVILIVLPNLWCMLVHLFAALPQGLEYHRGYQHGGMIIDFVGQKPPTYRTYYLLADFFILGLQCLMLAVHAERERLRLSLKTFQPLITDPARRVQVATARAIEDLDLEEQLIDSSGPSMSGAADGGGDIELQPLRRSSSRSGRTEASELGLRTNSGDDISRSRLSDILSSGNAMLDDYHILHCMRVAAIDLERTTAESLQSIGYQATTGALDSQRRRAAVQGLLLEPGTGGV